MKYKFVEGDTIFILSLTSIMVERKIGENTMRSALNLSAFSDPFRNDFHDSIRFIYDSKSFLTRQNYIPEK